jgi:hypothetical protein
VALHRPTLTLISADLTILEQPRWEDFEYTYRSGNTFGFLGDGFDVREFDGVSICNFGSLSVTDISILLEGFDMVLWVD